MSKVAVKSNIFIEICREFRNKCVYLPCRYITYINFTMKRRRKSLPRFNLNHSFFKVYVLKEFDVVVGNCLGIFSVCGAGC